MSGAEYPISDSLIVLIISSLLKSALDTFLGSIPIFINSASSYPRSFKISFNSSPEYMSKPSSKDSILISSTCSINAGKSNLDFGNDKNFFLTAGTISSTTLPNGISLNAPATIGVAAIPPTTFLLPTSIGSDVLLDKLLKNFNIFDLSSFKERFEDDVFTMFRENAYFYDKDEMSEIILDAFDEKELIDMGMDPKNLGEAEFTDDRIVERLYPDDPNIPDQSEILESYASETETLDETDNIIFKMKQELKQKFPDSSPSEIDEQFDFLNLENLDSPYTEGASRESVENRMKQNMKEKFGELYED